MASWILKSGVSILLAARVSNAQLASSTPNGNLSVSTTATPGPTATGGSCCVAVPINVGLNFWWSETLTATVATVITQVYQYNNTAITSTTTISGNASVSAPQSIIPGTFIYSQTIIGNSTVVSLPNTQVASPTPFVDVRQVGMIYGTWAETSGTLDCDETSMDQPRGLSTNYGYVEDPPVSRTTHQAYANPPKASDFIDFWIQNEPTITDEIPGLRTCTVPSGSGEPSVHVPVTGLTSHATTTIKMDGGAPIPTTTKVPAEPAVTPTTTSEPEPEPTTTNAPEPEPTTTNAPEPEPTTNVPEPAPEPTTTANPPPAQGTTVLPPPENTSGNEPAQPPPATTGSNPNPNPNPNNPGQSAPTAPTAPTGGSPNNPQQPAPTTAGQPAPTTAGQPAPTTAGQPSNNNPSNPNPPVAPLPIDLTPVPAPAPAPTTAGAPPVAQPVNPPAVILPNGETLQPGTVTTISDHTVSIPTDAPSATVIGGTTVQAPPVVVVDGTTATLAPTSVNAPVVPVTVGEGSSASVVSITAVPSDSGGGVVLPNGETLRPGSTATYLGETLVLTTASEGSSTVVQVIDSSTTEMVTIPTAASSSVYVYGNGTTSTGSGSGSGTPSQTTSGAPVEATGAGDELVPQGVAAVLAAMGAVVVLGL